MNATERNSLEALAEGWQRRHRLDNSDAQHMREKTYEQCADELMTLIATFDAKPATRYPWPDAPERAMWAATDACGNSYWYAEKPTAVEASQEWNGFDYSLIAFGDYSENWRTSIEARPT